MRTVIIVVLLGLLSTSLLGQSRSDECRSEYNRLNPTVPIPTGQDPCKVLASHLQSELDEFRLLNEGVRTLSPIPVEMSPRDLQSRKSDAANSVAAPNQGDAVPALYPFALAGGAIGGSGSEGGTNALTTLSLNPAIFFANMDDPAESARLGRLMDFSVVVPMTNLDNSDFNKLQYLGLRARVNMTGVDEGGDLYENVRQEFRHVMVNASNEKNGIEALLRSAPDCGACVSQLIKVINSGASDTTIREQCGSDFSVSIGDEAFESFSHVMDQLVEDADKRYFGLDLRADFGDPTLGAVDSARGTSFFAGAGFGFSLDNENPSRGTTNFNSRLGVRYKDMESIDATVFDVDAAAGIEIARPFQFQQIKFGAGLEFRKSMQEVVDEALVMEELDEAFETDYLYFRTSLQVPITPANSFSLQYGTSFIGNKPSVLAINFNWKLLLED